MTVGNTSYAYVVDGNDVLVDNGGDGYTDELSPKLIQLGIELLTTVGNYTGIARLSAGVVLAKQEQAQFAIDKKTAVSLGLLNQEKNEQDNHCHFVSFRQLASCVSTPVLHLLSQSIQRLRWQAEHQFCCKCGQSTKPHPIYSAVVCHQCHYSQYTQIQPCVITAITHTNPNNGKRQILLANHHRHNQSSNKNNISNNTDNKSMCGMYGLIAGFVEVGESLEHAVHREVLEEVGLQVQNLRYFSSQPWPYPSNLMLGFIADYDSGEIVLQEDELADARFFDIDDLPHIPPVGSIARALIEHVVAEG